ncbi:hypothetical protein ACFJGW_07150 [Burkholderiaceae bacterium UC74_6]
MQTPLNPIADLETLREIALRHGYDGHAALVGELLTRAAKDRQAIWGALNTIDVWGGAGSVADIALGAMSRLPDAQVRADEFRWRNALISLSIGMHENGISNSRAQSWAETFQAWNDARNGI